MPRVASKGTHWSLLSAIALLVAGCSAPAAEEVAPEAAEDEPDRTARGHSGGAGEGAEEVPTDPVVILRTPFTMAGPLPQSFDVIVPEAVDSVDFHLASSTVAWGEVGLRVEMSDCGVYDRGIAASAGGSGKSGRICGNAQPGPQVVTVSGTFVVFDGDLLITTNVRLPENATPVA